MRRIVLIVSVAALSTIHPLASDTLLNFAYNIQSFPSMDLKINSVGLAWTIAPSEGRGYYGQLISSYALNAEVQGYQLSYSTYDMFGVGLNFTIGMGERLKFGQMGLLLGGGFVGDAFAEFADQVGFLDFAGTFGGGGGVHVIFTPPGQVIGFNMGVNYSWRPAGIWVIPGYGTDFRFLPSNFNVNVNAGFAFAAPTRAQRVAKRKAKPRWDDSMNGPRRRIALDTVFGGGSMGSVRLWVFPVRDLWFVRAGAGFTIPSADPLLVNVPVSLATGIYPFPRRLRTVRAYVGILDTINVASYLEGRGVSGLGHYSDQRLWQNLGVMVGAEYNFSTHIGISIEPSYYPLLAGVGEGSSFQLALAVRVM